MANPLSYLQGPLGPLLSGTKNPALGKFQAPNTIKGSMGSANPLSYLQGPLAPLVTGTQNPALGKMQAPSSNYIKDTLTGTPSKFEEVQRFTPQQQQAFQQILGLGLGGLQNPTMGFQPIRENALNTYNQQIIPSLSERFTSMGGHGTGALSSPAFTSQLAQAGTGLTSDLAAMEAQYGQNAISQLLQLLNLGLTPQFEQAYRQGTTGLLGPLLQGLGSGIGNYGSTALMGLL